MVDNSVKGKTAVYGVIGCPIEHTFSPAIHNTMAKTLNKDMIYEAFRVEKDNLESAIKGAYSLGIKGLNVTVPHKVEVMKCLCDIDKRAKVIGAVNTLKYTENGYVGYNTDIIGVYYAIKNKGFDVKGKTVLLLGAGGAGNACGVMAADKGAKMLYIANRTVSKADKLAESIRAEYPDTEIKTLSIDDIYDIPNVSIKRIVIVDLNERSLLDKDRALTEEIIDRICSLLKAEDIQNTQLKKNLTAIEKKEIRTQMIKIIELATTSSEHYAVRDILGAVSFILTACTMEEYEGMPYYDAVFESTNPLLETVKQFDPIYLSHSVMDEALWNGEIKEKWLLDSPTEWPSAERYEEEALLNALSLLRESIILRMKTVLIYLCYSRMKSKDVRKYSLHLKHRKNKSKNVLLEA